jgi:PAS domain S-box-containing protein
MQKTLAPNQRTFRQKGEARKTPRVAVLRALLADIVESTGEAIYSRKLDGTVSSWNAAAERIFGYKAGEIIGRSSALLLPPDRADETRQVLERVRRGERITHFETVRLRRDGKPLTISMCVSPIRNATRRIVGASTIARDVTAERDLEARLLETGERERQRLGRDLHDGLGQQLGGMELLCRTLAASLNRRHRPETRTAELLVTQIREAIAQTRALARGLAPVLDSPTGLMLALEDFTANAQSLFGIKCAFLCDEPVLVPDHAAAVHLFRIAQESFNNALRHGAARRIELQLLRKGGNLLLHIRNDGRRLPAAWETSAGLGIRIMHYRTSVLGGSIRWCNTRPRGVLVTCIVPLPNRPINL